MKPIFNANRPLQVPILAADLSINVVVHAQPLPALAGLPATETPVMPVASAAPSTRSLPDLPLREVPYDALSNTCVTGQLQVIL